MLEDLVAFGPHVRLRGLAGFPGCEHGPATTSSAVFPLTAPVMRRPTASARRVMPVRGRLMSPGLFHLAVPPGLAATRVFSDPDTGFHPEAYLFAAADGTAAETFVSSNSFSASGITGGIESAIGTTSAAPPLAACEQLRSDQRAKPLTREFLAGVPAAVAAGVLVAAATAAAATRWRQRSGEGSSWSAALTGKPWRWPTGRSLSSSPCRSARRLGRSNNENGERRQAAAGLLPAGGAAESPRP